MLGLKIILVASATSYFLGLDPHLLSLPPFDGILVDITTLTASFAISTFFHVSPHRQNLRHLHSCIHAILQHYVGPTKAAPSFSGGSSKQNGPLPAHMPPYLVPSDTSERRATAPPSRSAGLPPTGVAAASPWRGRPPPPSLPALR